MPDNSTMRLKFSSGQSATGESSFSSKNWIVWIGGLGISMLPLFCVAIDKYIRENYSFEQSLVVWWGKREILYICVSLAVAALFELLARPKNNTFNTKKLVSGILLVCGIILSAILYTIFTVHNFNDNSKLAGLSLTILALVLIVGTVSFFNEKGSLTHG